VSAGEKRPAIALLGLGGLLAGLGFLLPDERLRVLLVLLAVPMLIGGVVTIAWGNARTEIERLRGDR
jgi:hypothetical protein